MRLVGLISGGKDSMYNMLQCIAANHEIVAVANIEPYKSGELDSYMYQTVGHEAITLVAAALGLPIFRQKTSGKAICSNRSYIQTVNDEVEDLTILLSNVKKAMKIDGVSVGAIASDYQRTRVENVCSRLNLKCFAYLWRRDQIELLQEMIDAELEAIIIKVACMGLKPENHLGMSIKDIQPHLLELNKQFGMNVCGEGGEYETLTLDCPLYQRAITVTSSENVILSNDPFAPVAYLCVKKAELDKKCLRDKPGSTLLIHDQLKIIRANIRNPEFYIRDCVDDFSLNVFPQNILKPKVHDLQLPFEEETIPSTSKVGLREYWKDSNLPKVRDNEKQSVPHSSIDLAMYDLNITSGWCCIGNITGPNLLEALNCLKKHLRRMNFDFTDIVFINLFVRDMSSFDSMNKTYSQFTSEIKPPARACVETVLPCDVGVLLVAVAHKLVSKSQQVINANHDDRREVLHVQSISHWAPANIGPYSQCVKVSEIYYVAGQIPLIPGSMEILNKPIIHQCKLTLRHVLRILQAMNRAFTYSNVFQAICYVVSVEIAAEMHLQWEYLTKVKHTAVSVVVVTELPRKAQLEWEVIACSFENATVQKVVEVINLFNVQIKRCVYLKQNVASIVCQISYLEKSSGKSATKLNQVQDLVKVIQYCIQFLKKDFESSNTRLCNLKLFYKSSECFPNLAQDILQSIKDPKVVFSAIPVVACENSKILMTLSGICT